MFCKLCLPPFSSISFPFPAKESTDGVLMSLWKLLGSQDFVKDRAVASWNFVWGIPTFEVRDLYFSKSWSNSELLLFLQLLESFKYYCCHCSHLSFTPDRFFGLFHLLLTHWMNSQVSFQQPRIHSFSTKAFLPDMCNQSKWTGTSFVPSSCFSRIENVLERRLQNFLVSKEVLLSVHASVFACLLCGMSCKSYKWKGNSIPPYLRSRLEQSTYAGSCDSCAGYQVSYPGFQKLLV